MKKEIASGLLKIANTLDNMGLIQEANIVDRVAKKIVVSKNPEVKFLNNNEIPSAVTGDYLTDITNIKNMLFTAFKDDNKNQRKNADQKMISKARKLLTLVQNSDMYTKQEKKVFGLQASRIYKDYSEDQVPINNKLGDETTESLNEYLFKFGITDQMGNLNSSITDMSDFNKRWNSFKNQPIIMKQISEFPDYMKLQLGRTYKMLTAKFQ
jgi:hypothetical protein